MSNEDYVSLEVARKLREKGFDEMCHAFWWNHEGETRLNTRDYNFTKDWLEDRYKCFDCVLLAPTLYEAQKWLREEKGLCVEVSYMSGDYYIYDILTIPNHDLIGLSEVRRFNSSKYEECLNAGILEALILI